MADSCLEVLVCLRTCNNKDDSTEYLPALLAVVLEEANDVDWRQGLEHSWVELGDVVHSDDRRGEKPEYHDRREEKSHLGCAKPLEQKQ